MRDAPDLRHSRASRFSAQRGRTGSQRKGHDLLLRQQDRAPGPGHVDVPPHWDDAADIVVIGAGATGLPAAIVAREAGASVILVETEPHIGGPALVSGGQPPARGG